jgi:ribonucleoside-diphosphate reductase alpha chain
MKVQKRHGAVVDFDPSMVAAAIYKAFAAVGRGEGGEAGRARGCRGSKDVWRWHYSTDTAGTVRVEDLQDLREKVLIEEGYAKVVKVYILYRQKRSEIRKAKRYLGVSDDMKLSLNAAW